MFEFLKPKDGPVVEGFQHREIIYAKDQPEYNSLRTLRSNKGVVLSRWTLTDEQRKTIIDGADIFLELHTFNQPLQPIRIMIGDGSITNECSFISEAIDDN